MTLNETLEQLKALAHEPTRKHNAKLEGLHLALRPDLDQLHGEPPSVTRCRSGAVWRTEAQVVEKGV